jgi:hypothetical protein
VEGQSFVVKKWKDMKIKTTRSKHIRVAPETGVITGGTVTTGKCISTKACWQFEKLARVTRSTPFGWSFGEIWPMYLFALAR